MNGWLPKARRVPSPNWDERPANSVVDLVVVHGISLPPGSFGGPWIEHLFTNRLDPAAHPYFRGIADLKVSAHLLILRGGELIQFVDLRHRAWHAGDSCFGGRERCNDFSVGIELEGTDEFRYEDEQYRALADATLEILKRFPSITPQRIVGHCDIAPGRKTDPGPAFDWERFRGLIA